MERLTAAAKVKGHHRPFPVACSATSCRSQEEPTQRAHTAAVAGGVAAVVGGVVTDSVQTEVSFLRRLSLQLSFQAAATQTQRRKRRPDSGVCFPTWPLFSDTSCDFQMAASLARLRLTLSSALNKLLRVCRSRRPSAVSEPNYPKTPQQRRSESVGASDEEEEEEQLSGENMFTFT